MAWVEFHAARIRRLQKFSRFRRALGLDALTALGLLGAFWGEVIELADDGDITGWTPEYLADLVGVTKIEPERLFAALRDGWIDERGGRLLVHDWLKTAGTFLRKKYGRDDLLAIWLKYGVIYGAESAGDDSGRKPAGKRPESGRDPALPNQPNQPTEPNQPRDQETPPASTAPCADGDQMDPADWLYTELCKAPAGQGSTPRELIWSVDRRTLQRTKESAGSLIELKGREEALRLCQEAYSASPAPTMALIVKTALDILARSAGRKRKGEVGKLPTRSEIEKLGDQNGTF